MFDTWLETVERAAVEASESFELVALETLRRLRGQVPHPFHPVMPESLPDPGGWIRNDLRVLPRCRHLRQGFWIPLCVTPAVAGTYLPM
jgi:hypothetical protein